jgi:transposase
MLVGTKLSSGVNREASVRLLRALKHRLGGISKRGNQYLRRLLINGASANLLRSKATNADPWVIGLRQRRPSLVVAVALANKTARIAWAVMHRHENYQRVAAAA